MLGVVSKSRAFFATKVGRCATCMRQSLIAALAAWALFGVGLLMGPDALVQGLTGLAAFGLTALWLSHVAAYAARAVAETRRGSGKELTLDNISRRRAFGLIMRAAGAGVVVSAPVLLWPSDSFAFCGQCTQNRDCGTGFVCRNTAPVNSGKVCNECVRG